MNLKELHNPTLRQEDNRLYLVGNTKNKPKNKDYHAHKDLVIAFKIWQKSEVKYPVRESDEIGTKNLIREPLNNPSGQDWVDQLSKGIPVPPELMERLELLNTDLFHDGKYPNFCSQCKVAFTGHKRQLVCKKCCDSKIIVTLKEEPKGESEDEYFVIVTTQGNFDIEDDINIPSGRYKLVKVK